MGVRGGVRMILTKNKLSLPSIPNTRQLQLSFPVSAFSKDRAYVLYFSVVVAAARVFCFL